MVKVTYLHLRHKVLLGKKGSLVTVSQLLHYENGTDVEQYQFW